MKRLQILIRRHPRVLAGFAAVLLAAAVPFALGAAGSARAQAPRTASVARTSFPSSAQPTRPAPIAAGVVAHARPVALRIRIRHHGAAPERPGIAAAAPSSHGVALALRRATGLSPSQVAARELCPPAGAGHARCAGEALVLRSDGALVHPRVAAASSTSAPAADTPAYLEQAYDLAYLSQYQGIGDTVAVVDAYDDPTAQSDLDKFRSQFGLSPCDSGCFTKLNQAGSASPLPAPSGVWDQEISLDLDAVSAICPNCHILLVESNSSGATDMQAAMRTAAAAPGVKQISASWTLTSSSAPPGQYTFPGIATVAATGDTGYLGPGADNYPAALPGVTAAGGTSLAPATTAPNARGFSEGAWSGAGSGCDLAVPKPIWQSDTACVGRSYADLSADADPNTGLAVVDGGQWLQFGGTSLATPLIAAYYAITGVSDTSPQWAYGAAGRLNDVTSGSNGSCDARIAYICTAATGYDGPTGVGSISGAVVTGAPGIGGPAISSGGADSYTQSVAAHSATITGGIYRNGLDTTWWIQYGTSKQYGSQTQPTDTGGAGSAPVAVSGSLSGLTPNTTYHYRLVARNSAGSSYGYDYTFSTPPAPAGTPTASFSASPTAPTPSSLVTFSAGTSSPSTGLTYTWSFGDGATSSGETTTHSFSRGVYTVTLTVTNTAGQSDTNTQTVSVDTAPGSAFNVSAPATGASTVSFDGTATTPGAGGSIADYSWNFGDGWTADTGATPTAAHAYGAPGVYTVILTTTDDLGVSSKVSGTVIAGFSASTTNPVPGSPVTFTVPSSLSGLSGTITDYSWSFGDGTTDSTGTTPTDAHTYATPARYTVALTITTTDQSVTADETITVDDPPSAALQSGPIIAAPGASVAFNGSASAAATPETINTYTWDFGDGSAPFTGSSPSATHVYRAPGRYTATLMVTDNLGVPATTAATLEVIVDQPAPAFTPSATTVAPNAIASFDASGSSDPEGSPVADYSWNFGDGSSKDTGTTPSATHSYSQRKNYTVTLTMTNGYYQTASTTQTVTVDNPPTAAFTPSASVAASGDTLQFNAGASAAMTGGSIVDYSWSFGDGSTEDAGAAATVAHVYMAAGTYPVTLTTTDDLGLSATSSESVTIQAAPGSGTQTSPSPSPTPAPAPSPAPAPTPPSSGPPSSSSPAPVPAPKALVASLSAASRQRLAPVLAHGLHLRLSVSEGTHASFQITLPVAESRLAGAAHKPKTASIVLLRSRAQALGAGRHAITLKLSRGAARELAGAGPLVLTVKVSLTEASGATVTRTVKITLAR